MVIGRDRGRRGHDAIATRLRSVVGRLIGDVRWRRRLRYRPHEALAEMGWPSADAPAELGVRHTTIQVTIDEAHLFGCAGPAAVTPPLAARLVQLGARPLALIHGPERDLIGLRQWAESRGLVAILSPWQLVLRCDQGKGGFSNLADEQPAVAGSGAHRGLLVAADPDRAMLGWLALLCRWDQFLGRLLGYPNCCAEAFAIGWPRARDQHQGDLAGLVASSAGCGPFPWPLNILLRYHGLELIPHFPCRFDCCASLELARRTLVILDLVDSDLAQRLRVGLPAVVVYTEGAGVFAWRDGALDRTDPRAQTFRGDPRDLVMTETSSTFAQALASGAVVQVDRDGLCCGGVVERGWLLDFRLEPDESWRSRVKSDFGGRPFADPLLWLRRGEVTSGIVAPGPAGGLLEAARLDLAASVRRAARARTTAPRSAVEPRGWQGFATSLLDHVARSPVETIVGWLRLGKLAVALGTSPDETVVLGAIATEILADLPEGGGLVLPEQLFSQQDDSAHFEVPSLGLRLVGPGGPVAVRAVGPRGTGWCVTWVDGRTASLGDGDPETAAPGRLLAGAVIAGFPVRTVLDGAEASTPPTADVLESLAAGLDLLARCSPQTMQSIERGVRALVLTVSGHSPPTPDTLTLGTAALSSAAGSIAPGIELGLGQPLTAALALAAADGRRRVLAAWPLLAGSAASCDLLVAAWDEAAASPLAEAVATVAAWQVLVEVLQQLVAEDGGGVVAPPEVRAGLAALAAAARSSALNTDDLSTLPAEVAKTLVGEVDTALAGLELATTTLGDRWAALQRAPTRRQENHTMDPQHHSVLWSAAQLEAARESFSSLGVATPPTAVLATQLFLALADESVACARKAWACDRTAPAQSCWRADLGPVAHTTTALLLPALETIVGARLKLSPSASCYTYYVGPNSFGGRHQDREGTCTVTCLVYLHAASTTDPPSAGLSLRVWHAGEAASVEPFLVIPTLPNRGVVLQGSRLPHERPQLAAGEAVSLLALCFSTEDVATEGASG